MKILYEYSSSSINVFVWLYGSLANMASLRNELDILKYIHSIKPELMLMADDFGWNPLSRAVTSRDSDFTFVKGVYALGPTVISKVRFY